MTAGSQGKQVPIRSTVEDEYHPSFYNHCLGEKTRHHIKPNVKTRAGQYGKK